MSTHSECLDEVTAAYVRAVSMRRESETLARLREATAPLELAQMQISVEQGRLMALIARLLGARRALEVGTFTGYSALCVAEALPADGLLIACDVSEDWTSMGRPFWIEAGVADRIDLRLGPASETLAQLIADGHAGSFDIAFIDADKPAYPDYYEQVLTLLHPGGAVLLDNIFMHGRAIDPDPDDAGSTAIHRLTDAIFADDRVEPALIPIGDGILMARKR